MSVSAASEPSRSDVENEDWFSTSPDLVVVLDGSTARTDTGCRHGVSWYVAQLGAHLSTLAVDRASTLRSVLASSIGRVAEMHRDCDLRNPATPAAAVAILRTSKDAVE